MLVVLARCRGGKHGIITRKMNRIRIVVGEQVLTATLASNATAQDFATLLPLTLTLRDYHHTEKISDLPRKLAMTGAPDGYQPAVGDITYYAPWGNLALFYQDFSYSYGLVRLGRLDAGLEMLTAAGSKEQQVRIERLP
jgi:hypothetical protein